MKIVEFRRPAEPGIEGEPVYVVSAYVVKVWPASESHPLFEGPRTYIQTVDGRLFDVAGPAHEVVARLFTTVDRLLPPHGSIIAAD